MDKKTAAAYQKIVDFFNPLSNFKSYRMRLATTKPPAIPLLSLLLSDLTMLEENENFLKLDEGEVIHFEKMNMIFESLSVTKRLLVLTPLRSPRSPTKKEADPLLVMLNVLPHLAEEELYEFKGENDKIKTKQIKKELKAAQKQRKKTKK